MIKYKYFVSYTYQNSKGHGFGDFSATLNFRIKTTDDIDRIRNSIQDRQIEKDTMIIILNYKLIGWRFWFNDK